MKTTMMDLMIPMAFFLGCMLIIGLISSRKSKTMRDYLVADKSLPTWMAILTFTATMFGGGMLTGRAQNAYLSGYFFLWYGLGAVVGRVLLCILITKMEDFTSQATVTQYLETRYHSRFLRVACSCLSMVALLGVTASNVSALTSILAALGFENTKLCAFVAMTVIIILTSVGGIWAVTTTDSFQIIVVAVGLFWLLFSVFGHYDGVRNLIVQLNSNASSLPTNFTNLFAPEHIPKWFIMCIPGIMNNLIGQECYQRLYACKNLHEARKCALISSLIAFVLTLAPCFIGFAGRLEMPQLAENGTSATVLAEMALKHMPGLASGFFLCACLGAILSTADSNLSAVTSHLMNDIIIPITGNHDEKKNMLISRVATAVMGFVAMFISFNIKNIVTAMLSGYTIYTAGALVPIVLGVLWQGANKTGAIFGLIAGCVMCVIGLAGFKIGSIPGELLSAVVGLIVTVVVSLITTKSSKKGVLQE